MRVRCAGPGRGATCVALAIGLLLTAQTATSLAVVGRLDLPGDPDEVVVRDGVAYVARAARTSRPLAPGLSIVDVSDPSTPTLLAEVDLPGSPVGIDVEDGIAYVAASAAGLRVIDVTDPAAPVELGFINTDGQAWSVDVRGSLAYIVGTGPLAIYDVSDPTAPVALGREFFLAPSIRIRVFGDHAYVLDSLAMRVVDVSDPSAPEWVNSQPEFRFLRDLVLVGDVGYTAGFDGLGVVDASDPTDLRVLSQLNGFSASAVQTADSIVYMAAFGAGFYVADVSAPEAPRLLGRLFTEKSVVGIAVEDGLAYLSSDEEFSRAEDGLEIVDLAHLETPAERSVLERPFTRNVAIDRGVAHVTGSSFGLIDVLDPDAPAPLTERDDAGGDGGVAVADGIAYVGHQLGLQVFDVTEPASPTRVGEIDLGVQPWNVAVSGETAVITTRMLGLRVLDVSDRTAPREVGSFSIHGSASDVALHGDIAYVAWIGSGLRVLNLSDPTRPTEIAAVSVGASSIDVSDDGSILYVYTGARTLDVFDVSDPSAPTLLGRFPVLQRGAYVTAAGPFVYLSGDEAVLVYDVGDPTAPSLRGGFELPDGAFEVDVRGRFAYLASGRDGLRIVDLGEENAGPVRERVEILPLGRPTQVLPGSLARLGVVLFGSRSFAISQVDRSTLRFGPAGAAPLGNPPPREHDVDRDGWSDLTLRFETRASGIALGDGEACLEGETSAGLAFGGCGEIRTGPNCGDGYLASLAILPGVFLLLRRSRWAARLR